MEVLRSGSAQQSSAVSSSGNENRLGGQTMVAAVAEAVVLTVTVFYAAALFAGILSIALSHSVSLSRSLLLASWTTADCRRRLGRRCAVLFSLASTTLSLSVLAFHHHHHHQFQSLPPCVRRRRSHQTLCAFVHSGRDDCGRLQRRARKKSGHWPSSMSQSFGSDIGCVYCVFSFGMIRFGMGT